MPATAQFQEIEKEVLATLQFPDTEVLHDPVAIQDRERELKKALTLGNLEHSKAKIYFEDDSNCYMVETTVWGVTDKRVILKQGNVIPIKRVHRVSV